MRFLAFLLIYLLPVLIYGEVSSRPKATSLQEQICKAEAGSYVVTEQEKNYSLLLIRSMTSDILLLEELSVPVDQIDLENHSWKSWLEKKAPGHTSWTFYQINLKTSSLEEAFSYTKKSWLILDDDQILTKLFALSLQPLPSEQRKRIGPPPPPGEADRRSLWIPPLFIEGKKIEKPLINAYQARWPRDHSKLSECPLELYFSPLVPFPVWIEVKSPHYTFKLRTVNSGKGLFSPLSFRMPLRPPQFVSTQRIEHGVRLSVKSPAYFEKLNLFAIDATDPSAAIPISYTASSGTNKEERILDVDQRLLQKAFKENHRYQWVLVPEEASDIYVESDEPFLWKTP